METLEEITLSMVKISESTLPVGQMNGTFA